MSRRAQVKREAQERLTKALAERDAKRELEQRLRDMTIVERNSRGRVTGVERPLPYGGLPASAAETPGFVVGMPVDPTTFPTGEPPATGLSDDTSARDSEYRRMAQQYGDAELKNALLSQAGDGVNLADYYGAQKQLGGMVSGDSDTGEAMVQYFMTRPGFETRDKVEAFIAQNPGIAFREFNKANPMAMVGDKPAMIEEEAITDYMDTGLDRDEAIRRIRGGMPAQQESNIEQTAAAQPVDQQRQLNLDEVQKYMDSGVPGLNGKQMLGEAIKKKIALTPTQLRNDPFLR